MARKKIKNKDVNRKDDLDPNKDEFIQTATTALDWAYERRRLIGLLVVVALVVALAVIGTRHVMHSARVDESAKLAAGLDAIVAPIIPTDALPKDKDEELLSFDSYKARATESLKRFEEAGQQSPAIDALIALGKAGAQFDLGEYDKAVSSYEAFFASADASLEWLRPAATESLALALTEAGKPDDALAKLETIETGEGTQLVAGMAQYQAARVAQKKGDLDGAKQKLQTLVDSYGEGKAKRRLDYVFVQARSRLLELDPTAQVPDVDGGFGGLNNIDPEILRQIMQSRGGAS